MEASLDVAYGKSRASGKDAAVDGIMKTLNTVSVRVHETQEEGSPVTDMEIIDLFANLDITPRGGMPTNPPSRKRRSGQQ